MGGPLPDYKCDGIGHSFNDSLGLPRGVLLSLLLLAWHPLRAPGVRFPPEAMAKAAPLRGGSCTLGIPAIIERFAFVEGGQMSFHSKRRAVCGLGQSLDVPLFLVLDKDRVVTGRQNLTGLWHLVAHVLGHVAAWGALQNLRAHLADAD